jgi:hypothetical protein
MRLLKSLVAEKKQRLYKMNVKFAFLNEILKMKLVNENKKEVVQVIKKKNELFMGLNKHQEHIILKLMII